MRVKKILALAIVAVAVVVSAVVVVAVAAVVVVVVVAVAAVVVVVVAAVARQGRSSMKRNGTGQVFLGRSLLQTFVLKTSKDIFMSF